MWANWSSKHEEKTSYSTLYSSSPYSSSLLPSHLPTKPLSPSSSLPQLLSTQLQSVANWSSRHEEQSFIARMLVSPFPLSPPHTPPSLTLPSFPSPSQASPSCSLPQLHSSSVLLASSPLTPPPPPSVPRTRPVVKMTLMHTTLTQVLAVLTCGSWNVWSCLTYLIG